MTQHKPRRVQLVVFTILEVLANLMIIWVCGKALWWILVKFMNHLAPLTEKITEAYRNQTPPGNSVVWAFCIFGLTLFSMHACAMLAAYLLTKVRRSARYYMSRARGIECQVVTVKVAQTQRPGTAGMMLVYGAPLEKATYAPVPPTLKGGSFFTYTKALLRYLDTPVQSVPVITHEGVPLSTPSTEEVEGHPMKVFRDGHWQDRD